MKRVFKLLSLMSAIAVLAVAAMMPGTYAKPEYAKKEKVSCKTCHSSSKPSKNDLTDAGKYYKDKGTLKGHQGKK